MLTLCGFVEKAGNTIKVTKVGTAVVKGTGLARDYAWRSALLALELPGTNGSSHPYRILLRLVSEFPGIEKKKLSLALEADNDSETEFQRITKLTTLPFDQLLEQTGATEAHAANAIKILPSIAEQLGDVRRDGQKACPRSKFNVTEDGTEFEHGPLATPPKINLTPDTIAPDPTFQGSSGTKVDLSAAIEFRKLRTLDHQRTIRALAKDYASAGFSLSAHPYDCLASKGEKRILNEVKTLDGSASDERSQVERAVGQLHGYRFHELSAPSLGSIPLVAAFPRPLSDTGLSFLRDGGLVSAWLDDNGKWQLLRPTGESGNFAPDALI